MKDCPEGLQKIATTDDTQQLPPGAPIGMAISAQIAPADPAPIGTVGVRAEVHRGVDVAAPPPRGHEAGWRCCRGLRTGSDGGLTGVAVWLFDEACKGFRFTLALWPWG